jgi:hypothetical protein
MKFDNLHLILFILFIGMVLYLAFCNEQDTLTKREGKALAEKSELAIQKLDLMFEHLKELDSIKTINNYYSTVYKYEKQRKDSLLNLHPELTDSVFLFHVRKLRAEPSPLTE